MPRRQSRFGKSVVHTPSHTHTLARALFSDASSWNILTSGSGTVQNMSLT